MALDGFFINKLITESKNNLISYRVEKIQQLSKDIFIFNFYFQGNKTHLYLKLNAPNAAFFLGSQNKNNFEDTTNFLVTLKKHLEGMILTEISQKDFDRVVTFVFEGTDFLEGKVKKYLILELMGRNNNLILTKDNIIIDAYSKNFNASGRSILPKIEFEFFPTDKKVFNIDALNDIPTEKYLQQNYIGISPVLSSYLFFNKIDITSLNVKPTLNTVNSAYYWFDLFESDINKIYFDSLSEMIEYLISIPNVNNNKYVNFVNKEIIKYQKRLDKIIGSIEIANSNLQFKNYGDYIYSSGLNLNTNQSELVTYSNETITLNPLKTLNENAQGFYKQYQKAKRALTHLEEQKNEVMNILEIMDQFLFDLNEPNPNFNEFDLQLKEFGFKVKNKRTNKKMELLKYEHNNNIFYIGKNNFQNEYITHSLGKHNDYWFHVKDASGSHVLLKGELNDESLMIASMLAANNSSIKNANTIEVNYTQIKNVKKIPKIPGYHVSIKSFKTINIKVDNALLEKLSIA